MNAKKGELYPYQKEALEKIQSSDLFIADIPKGAGKGLIPVPSEEDPKGLPHYRIECACGYVGYTVTDEDRGGWESCPNCGMI